MYEIHTIPAHIAHPSLIQISPFEIFENTFQIPSPTLLEATKIDPNPFLYIPTLLREGKVENTKQEPQSKRFCLDFRQDPYKTLSSLGFWLRNLFLFFLLVNITNHVIPIYFPINDKQLIHYILIL